jgi:hypothetical protein
VSNKKMHSIFTCTSSENDRFNFNTSSPFNSWLKNDDSEVIHLSIDQANVDIFDKIEKK